MNRITRHSSQLDRRRDDASTLALVVLVGMGGGCKPPAGMDEAGGSESTGEHNGSSEATSSDTTSDTDDESTTGDGDGDLVCLPNDTCPCAPGDDHVVGLSTGKLGTACARFADDSLSCWGNYEAMTLHAEFDWWPYDAFNVFDNRCPTLPLRWYPRLTIPGGLVSVSTDPMQILGLDAEHRVGAVISPTLADLGWDLVDGVVSGYAGDTVEGWPEGSLAPEGTFVEVATGWFAESGRACARTQDGEVCCWGDPESGNAILGLPDWPSDAYFPAQAPEGSCWLQLTAPAVGMHVHNRSTCVWDAEGVLRCWGDGNYAGIFGYGHSDPVGAGLTPAEMPPVPVQGNVIAVDPPCAVLDDGRVTCWSWAAQWLGSPLALPEDVGADQAPVIDVGFPAVGVTVGGAPSTGQRICAWSADGRGKCWGDGEQDWAPDAPCRHGGGPPCEDWGDDESVASVPELSFGSPIRQVVDNGAVLVLLDDGRVQCWGAREQCPLDDGILESYTPKVAAGDVPPLNFHCDCAD